MQNTERQQYYSWLKLTVILIWILFYGLLNVVGSSGETNVNFDDPKVVALLYVGQFLGVLVFFILPAVLFAIFYTQKRIHYLGILNPPQISTLILGCLGIMLALPLINFIAQINEQIHLPAAWSGIEQWMRDSEAKAMELTELFTNGTSVGKLMLNLFVVAFMAALSEELFFRGMLQQVLIECFKNKHVGVWIGAILFSAFHLQFFGFFPRMLMGAYLGYLFLWSGSLWPGLMAHFLNNGMAVFLMWLANRGVISSDIDKIGSDANEMMLVIISAIVVTGSLILIYREEKKKKDMIIEN